MTNVRHHENEQLLDAIIQNLQQMLSQIKKSDIRKPAFNLENQIALMEQLETRIKEEGYGDSLLYKKGYFKIMMELYFSLGNLEKVKEFEAKIRKGVKGLYKDEVEVANESDQAKDSSEQALNDLENLEGILDAMAGSLLEEVDESQNQGEVLKIKEILAEQSEMLLIALEKMILKSEQSLSSEEVDSLIEVLESVGDNFERAGDDEQREEFAALYDRLEKFLKQKQIDLSKKEMPQESVIEHQRENVEVVQEIEQDVQATPSVSVEESLPSMDFNDSDIMTKPLTDAEIDQLDTLFSNYQKHIVEAAKDRRVEKNDATAKILKPLEELKRKEEKDRPPRSELYNVINQNKATFQARSYGYFVYRLAAKIITKITPKKLGLMWSKSNPVEGTKLMDNVDAIILNKPKKS